MKTIQFLFTTRHGTYFHLTPTNLAQLELKNALISVGDFAHMENVLKKLQEEKFSFKKYLGLEEENKIYLTAIDPYKERCIEGLQLSMTVKLKQNIGFRLYTIDQHNRMAELIEPDYLVSLTELPADAEEIGLKSNKRSVEKSLFFLEKTMNYFQDKPKKPSVYAAIQGGLNIELRTLAVYYTIQTCFKKNISLYDNFGGLVFYGFKPTDDWDQKDQAMESSLHEIPEDIRDDLSLVLAGKGDLLSIIWGVGWGFDKFEIEEPFHLAEKGEAIFLPQLHQSLQSEELDKYQGDQLQFFEFDNRFIETIAFPLKNPQHVPIDSSCKCFACLNHTQLYLNHLTQCKEMNAQVNNKIKLEVLLTIHNTHQYQTFYKTMQRMREANLQNQWFRWFISTLKNVFE